MRNIDKNILFKDIDAVIFDMDGTIIDSLYVWGEIDIEFLGSRGIDGPFGDYQGVISGMSFVQVAEYTKQRYDLSETVEEIMQIWNDMAEDKYARDVQYKPGAETFIKNCKRRGLKLGIATSNSRFLVEKLISRLHLDEYMDVILTGDEVTNGKPEPDIYLKVAELLGVNPDRCLVFEDVPAGIESGLRAGMKVCAVRDSVTLELDDVKRDMAHYYIEEYC